MAKQVFAVVLDSANDAVAEKIRGRYKGGDHYEHTPTLHLLAVDANTLTRTVAEAIGIREGEGENKPIGTGVVFKLNGAYAGFTQPTLWEWLSNAAAKEG